ncbi:cytochrome c oxidase, subunit II [Granulicella tundricola MP5ACTX9]|uniref:Cytochrome c oxidase subunit 2 n=2 Tax=Granulicella TaxID=940557 RepID=E8X2I4_GRATM|nr:cytochrome c oxidase, subunit II [Granulicella tundricola MP5ACTX9]
MLVVVDGIITVISEYCPFMLQLSCFVPTNIFMPAASPARAIFGLSILTLCIVTAIFLVVGGLLLYALIKFREKPQQDDREPVQLFGSNQIELSWTVIPILIVVVLFLATARVIIATERSHPPEGALHVTVVGHQYWWEFRYPGTQVVTANELHIPTSDPSHPRPTYLNMISADTDHSFWVPRLAGKMDVIPNKINVMWFDPQQPGLYLGQCAQYCGTQHAKMLIRVYAQTPSEFQQWMNAQALPAALDPQMSAGRAVFERNACMNCHQVRGTVADGRFGPDLTHFGSRDTLASGAVTNTPEHLRQWIADPSHYKDGALMPAMHLKDADIDLVSKYLESLQ